MLVYFFECLCSLLNILNLFFLFLCELEIVFSAKLFYFHTLYLFNYSFFQKNWVAENRMVQIPFFSKITVFFIKQYKMLFL